MIEKSSKKLAKVFALFDFRLEVEFLLRMMNGCMISNLKDLKGIAIAIDITRLLLLTQSKKTFKFL